MQFSAAQISLLINGTIEGNADAVVTSFGKIEVAEASQLTFLANLKYEEYLYTTNASIVILSESYELKQPVKPTIIRVADAYSAFALLLSKYEEVVRQQLKGIEDPSHIAPTASVGEDVYIGAFSYIGQHSQIGNNTRIYPNSYIGNNVKIGEHCTIHPGVKIYHDCVLGNNVIIHAGTVIGGDGFGFAPQADGSFKKVPQMGNVVIEDNVEVGSNTAIDRATIGSTIIKAGAKLDNLIQIAHNVEIGSNTVIAAQTGISGSTKIGKYAMIGGQVGIVGHISIADGTRINAQSGVAKSLKTANTSVTGTPAADYTRAMRSQLITRNLPEMERRIQELEMIVKQLMPEQVICS